MPLSPSTRLGPYEIVEPLGAGGMGEVYRARDTRLGRDVAIKVLPAHVADQPEARQRFEREARLVSSLNHPNICVLHDIGQQDGIDFLVMEYLEGETLAARLRKGPLPLAQALEYGVQITMALAEAHKRGVFHRDLKPGNIMLTKTGAKLLDFGLAKLARAEVAPGAEQATMSEALTGQGTILGTLPYMAPEQLEGKDADARSDIFAFGAVLYEMLTGRRAFEGKTQASLMAAILEHDPPPVAAPAALDRVLKRCLAKDPEDRWQSARDLMHELRWVQEANTAAPAETRQNRTVSWVLVAALAIVTLAAAAVAWRHWHEAPPEPRVTTLSLLPPEKTTFRDFAVSPDGRQLAFVATDASGKTQLWVRPLDSLAAQPLAGTEGADQPFWSPDSRFVGFFANAKLKKINASGGPAQTLCDASASPRGGAWGRSGVIVFANTFSPLYQVSEAGGKPEAVTLIDASRKESSHRWPHFLPDGRHFIHSVFTSQTEARGVYLGSVDSKESRRLVAADSSAAYAGPPVGSPGSGYLVFIRGQTLMAQPFDVDRLQSVGEAVPVAEPVGIVRGSLRGQFAVSESGVLVYDSGGFGVVTELTWLDRMGKRLGVVGPPAMYSVVSLAPDGNRLVTSRVDPNTHEYDVWLFELAGGIPSRFTFEPNGEIFPIWSADGSHIVFSFTHDGSWNLYQKLSSGAGGSELLLRSSVNKVAESWSRDGRFLLYHENDSKNGPDLWILPLEGERKPVPFLRTEFQESDGKFSPDGRWIAYQSNESGRFEVYVQPFSGMAGGAPSGAGSKWQISTAGGTEPGWRGDGRELFYLSPDLKLTAVEIKTAGDTFQAGVPRPLFQTRAAGNAPRYDVTSDGQRFFVVTSADVAASAPLTVVTNWQAGLKR
jgi:serine/threonine protein kinase/Tol biopolymer transport system component